MTSQGAPGMTSELLECFGQEFVDAREHLPGVVDQPRRDHRVVEQLKTADSDDHTPLSIIARHVPQL